MAVLGSAELYIRRIEQTTNKRLLESFERVRAACDFLESSRAAITPTSVGRYCAERWGGPKSQSIRNAGDTLFAYLKARAAEQVLPAASRNSAYEPPIQDETVRAYIALLKAERDEAVRAKNRIINGLRTIPGVPVDELIRDGHIAKQSTARENRKSLPPQLRAAIENLLNPDVLALVGLELYRLRLRNAMTNRVLLEKQHIEALMDLLESEKTELHGVALPSISEGLKELAP